MKIWAPYLWALCSVENFLLLFYKRLQVPAILTRLIIMSEMLPRRHGEHVNREEELSDVQGLDSEQNILTPCYKYWI
jgi:hypothetical protein